MSGLEVVGIAASIIQIADLGTKLSVKLFSFYRQIQNANKAIQHLSSDVALTCAILRELGDSLKQDEQSKLCSPEAHLAAKQMLKQCEEVLQQIQNMIDESRAPCKSRWQQATNRLRNVLNEPDVNLVRGNLERLKSTMLLLLNVVMFAGQIRNNHLPDMLHEQRNLIDILLREKKSDQVMTTNLNSTECFTSMPQPATPSFSVQTPYQSQPLVPIPANKEVQDYNLLIRAMLREIDGCKSKLEKSRHSRIRDGVLNVHSSEIVHFQRSYGPSIFQCFDDSIFEYDVAEVPPNQCASNSFVPSYILRNATVQGTANLGNSSDMQFTPLCSPALSPRDIPATGREKDRTVADFTEVSMSLEETKSQQPAVSPRPQRSQRPMKGDYKISYVSPESQYTPYVSTKSQYQHMLDGTQVPGLSYPETTPTTLTSRRTSQKIAEQGRRNRINNALNELETLMPPTFIQDQKSQRLAASSVAVDEADKPGNHFLGKAFMVETAIQYINELRRCLEGSDTSARIFVPAALSFERGPQKIQSQARRNRINVALKEIESMIPSEFVQARLSKNNSLSEVKSEVKSDGNIDNKFVTQAHSKASIVEMANDYIRELQRNLGDIPETLAQRLIPPRSPSSLSNPGLCEAETRRAPHDGSDISQFKVSESITSSPKPPANAAFVNYKGKAVMGQVETQDSSSKEEIRPRPVDLEETPQAPNPSEGFGTFVDLGDLPFELLDSGVESSQNATNYFEIAKFSDTIADTVKREEGLNPWPQAHSGSKHKDLQGSTIFPRFGNEVKTQLQRYQVHDSTRKPHQSTSKNGLVENNTRGQKRRLSSIDTNSFSTMIFEPSIEKHQKRNEKIASQDILLEVPNQKYSEDITDPLWPNSLEKALERWTNLKQNEILTEIVGC